MAEDRQCGFFWSRITPAGRERGAALRGAGWTVDLLHDGIAADLALASEDYALAILDVGCRGWMAFRCWRACAGAARRCRC